MFLSAWVMKIQISWLKKTLLFLIDHWKTILLILAGLIVLYWVVGFSFFDNEQSQIPGPSPVSTNQQIQNLETKTNEAKKETNTANENFANILNTDSSKRDSNWSNVKKKFCADHPNDSKCKQ